ncbi:MAG: hypothetical protein OXC68_11255 [Aestuariivita sp.]|nr:hypothetical protein [Aestuariivita sp.]
MTIPVWIISALWGGLCVAIIYEHIPIIKIALQNIRKFRRGKEVAKLYLGNAQVSTDPEEIAQWRREAKKRKKRDD